MAAFELDTLQVLENVLSAYIRVIFCVYACQ